MDQAALYQCIRDSGCEVLTFEDHPQFFGNWRAHFKRGPAIYEVVCDNREAWMAFAIGVFVSGCVAELYAIGPSVYGTDVRVTGLGWGIGIGRIGAIVSPLVAGRLLDGGWQPDRLYVAYGLVFAAAAIAVAMHRLETDKTAPQRAPRRQAA